MVTTGVLNQQQAANSLKPDLLRTLWGPREFLQKLLMLNGKMPWMNIWIIWKILFVP